MNRLDQISNYFNEKARKKLDNKSKLNSNGLPEMSEEEISVSCLENNGYETPELNDKLYLHFRGFKKIENLDRYTGCKSVWLDSNGFDKIENLDRLTELRCLYISKNLITNLEGLESLSQLSILDVSNNRISKIENIACCPNLKTLNISHNALSTAESLTHLEQCVSLQNIDVTNNKLIADESVLIVLSKVPALVALSLNGNEVTKIPSFRKKMISMKANLGYLDRPIDIQERKFAEAFIQGGADAEAIARSEWKELQNQKRIKEMEEFKQWQAEQFSIREKAREEGRSLIRDFSEEEQEMRRNEANAASEAEKKILEIGIDKLATTYWKLANDGNSNALDEAAEELLRRQQETVTTSESQSEEEGVPTDPIEPVDIRSASPSDKDGNNMPSEIVLEEFPETDELPAKEPGVEEMEEDSEEQRWEREKRVADSFQIYKKQLQSKRSSSHPHGGLSTTHDDGLHASTLSNSRGIEMLNSLSVSEDRPLYWSEEMDIMLAQLVKECVFDFEEISQKMISNALDGKFSDEGSVKLLDASFATKELNHDACRLRWAALDASQWASLPAESTALDTEFLVCINPSVLGAGHGAQPSFQAVAAIAASCMPTYLKPPTSFPSVRDIMEDDADLDLD